MNLASEVPTVKPLEIPRSLADRLGGRWIISWKVYIVLWCMSSIMVAFHLAESPSGNRAILAIYWISGTACAGIIALIAHRTVFKNRSLKPLPIFVVAIYQLFTNVTNSLIYESGREVANFNLPAPFITRFTTMFVLSVLVSLTVTLIIDHTSEWLTNRDSMIEARIQTVLLERSRIDLYRQIESQLSDDIKSSIENTNPNLLAEIKLQTRKSLLPFASNIADAVLDISVNVVRPLSNSLWKMSARTFPRTTLRHLLIQVTSRQPINTIAITIFFLVTSVSNALASIGLIGGMAWLSINVAIIFIISTTANYLIRRFRRFHVYVFIVAFVLFQGATYMVNSFNLRVGLAPISASFFSLQILASAILLVTTSTLGAWKTDHAHALQQVSAELNQDHIVAVALSRQLAENSRELARVLHGALQTRLTACSLMIERALATHDETSLNLALLEAVAVLQTPLPQIEEATTLHEEIRRKASLWTGLCAIDFEIEPSLQFLAHPKTQEIGRLVEEAIANAVRHGGATKISLCVTTDHNNSIIIQLDDNGMRSSNGKPGIGSAIFSQTTFDNWSRVALPQGSRLKATIPN